MPQPTPTPADVTKYHLGKLMLTIGADPELLLRVVADGPHRWRQAFMRECHTLLVDDHVADAIFAFFAQRVLHDYGMSASEALDAYAPPSPLTDAEIAASWEIESGSSVEGAKHFYGSTSPGEVLEKLMAGASPQEALGKP